MDTRRFLLIGFSFSLLLAPCGATSTLVWSIGKTDRSGAELGFARKHKEFTTHVSEPLRYAAEQDQPGRWPFIHPGPDDEWAGKKLHPLTVEFSLPESPAGEFALFVDTVGNHARPVILEVAVNGTSVTTELPPGGGDQVLEDESVGTARSKRFALHPSMLQQGRNEVVLTVVGGSWLLYDAIRLENDRGKQIPLFHGGRVTSPPFFVRKGSDLAQVVRLEVENSGRALEGELSAHFGGKAYTAPVSLTHGLNKLDVPVAEVSEPTSISLTLHTAAETINVSGDLLPQKKWTVYAVPSIHTDIGYTHTQEEVFKRHNDNLDIIAQLCRDNPLFKWNIEVAWELQNYANDRPASATQALLDLMKANKIGLHAGYLNMLTSLMADEAMNRYIYYAADLNRQHGLDISSAVLTDVPSATWALPTVLANSGVKYFAEGCNQDRGPILRNLENLDPFYWEGPDGSRVLTLLNKTYAQSRWFAEVENLNDMRERVIGLVRSFERPSYPYDAIYMYGAFWDNEAINNRYGHLLDDWQAAYEYPKLLLASGPEYFQHLEKKYASQIPVRRVDFGAYWEDGAGSTSHETTLHQHNQRRMVAAETIRTMARLAGSSIEPELEAFVRSWQQILFYIEHTWGAAQSISAPDSEMTLAQWSTKREYAHKPDAESRRLLSDGLTAYVKTVSAKAGDLVVANTLSWPRSGFVELPEGVPVDAVIRDAAGKKLPTQTHGSKRFFHATDVPAFGSRIYSVKSRPDPAGVQEAAREEVLENKFYRLTLDSTRGVRSLVDKASGAELLNPDSPYSLGQLVYACGGEGTLMVHEHSKVTPEFSFLESETTESLQPPQNRVVITPGKLNNFRITAHGPLWQEAELNCSAPSMPHVKTYVRLYNDEKRLEVDVQITSKTEIRRKEGVYVAFPLAAKQPKFRLGLGNAIADPAKDFAPGGCHEWYCAQDFVSCRDSQGGPEVVIASLDTPLLTLSDINRGRWPLEPQLTTATIFSYPMNNYWHTNYKAGQGGDFRFRYLLTSDARTAESDEARVRFSREAAQPLLAAVSPGANGKRSAPAIAVSGKGIVATTLKAAEVGEGFVLRLRNCEATSSTATVQLPKGFTGNVERLTLVENSVETLPVSGGKVRVPLAGQQTATVRFSLP